MGYVVIKVYSFECDHPEGCDAVIEAQCPSLPDAKQEIRGQGWTVMPGNVYLCPKH